MRTPTHPAPSQGETLNLARTNVKDLLLQSDAFRALPKATQQQIACDTVQIASYLAAPEGIPANQLPNAAPAAPAGSDPYALSLADGSRSRSGSRDIGDFEAQGRREGAAVAGVLLREVNFPEFVASLIQGVFHSIVQSSIEQMEAYGKLVADVAKSLNQFRDENVTSNQGRDHLVEQFPDTFMLDVDTGEDGNGRPRVRLRDGVDERAALEQVKDLPVDGGMKSMDLEDEATEAKLVQAARTQLATSRQQLLATMVLMGINRIVVTDGRISAKVMYDFRARDTFKASATAFDYENLGTKTTRAGEFESDRQGAETSYSREGDKRDYERRGGSYYAKGQYKTTSEPAVKITSAVAEATDAQLSTRASLAGTVDVNFKSETFPLEKMADSFQIGQIQNAADKKGSAAKAAGQAANGGAADGANTGTTAPAR